MNTAVKEGVIELSAESFSRRDERALPALVEPGHATPMGMLAMAVKQGMSLETIKELRELQKEWEADEARKAYNVAFAKFKAEAVKLLEPGMDLTPVFTDDGVLYVLSADPVRPGSFKSPRDALVKYFDGRARERLAMETRMVR